MAAAAVADFNRKTLDHSMLGSQSEHSDGGLEQPDIQLAQTNRAQVSTNLTNYSDQYHFFVCLI